MYSIDTMSRTPVYEQIIEQTQVLLISGKLHPGDALPSVRGLASELGVNPNTIQKAYTELDRRGLTTSVPGRGIFLRDDADQKLIQYLNETRLPDVQNILQVMQSAGLSNEDILGFVERQLNELSEPDETEG